MRAVVSLVARYRSPTTFEYANESCSDLSVGGMFIKSAAPAPAGTLLKLECEADIASDTKIRGVARVVWLRRETNEHGPSGMGVKFVKLEPGSRELIESIVQRLADAGVEARSMSAAPEQAAAAMAAGGGATASRPVQLVPSNPPPTGASDGASDVVASQADADLDAALERGSHSDELAPSYAANGGTYAESGYQASGDADSTAESTASVRPTGSSRPPAKSSRFGIRHLVLAIVLILVAIAIADRRGFGPSKTEVAPEESAPAAAAPVEQPEAPRQPEPARAQPAPGQPRQPDTIEPAPTGAEPTAAAAEPSAAPGEPVYPASPGDKQYMIEFVSRPNAATVSIDEKHTLTTPQTVNMGAMPDKVKVTARKPGFKSSSIWLSRDGFEQKDGMLQRRVYLTLKPEAATP